MQLTMLSEISQVGVLNVHAVNCSKHIAQSRVDVL